MSSSIVTHFCVIWIAILRIILAKLLKFPYAETMIFVADGSFSIAAIVHVGKPTLNVAQDKSGWRASYVTFASVCFGRP